MRKQKKSYLKEMSKRDKIYEDQLQKLKTEYGGIVEKLQQSVTEYRGKY